uniref:Uncharacterized protein n=1 Tax=Amphimedon queenslandica TaxID=400682 RepID=A0A1X7SJD4_AMPQE
MVFDDGDMKQVDATLNGVFATNPISMHLLPIRMKIIVILLSFLTSSIFCHEWAQISGGLTCITGSVNHVWGTTAQDHIYRCSQPCNGNWVRIDGGLRQVDVNDYEVWGVTSSNH